MTGPARAAQLAAKKNAVERLQVRLLGGDVGVTGHATRRHPTRIPEGRVAGGAFPDLCVGCYAADRRARLRVKQTRVEEHTTLQHRYGRHNYDRQCGDHKAGRGKAPETRLIHMPFPIRDYKE